MLYARHRSYIYICCEHQVHRRATARVTNPCEGVPPYGDVVPGTFLT